MNFLREQSNGLITVDGTLHQLPILKAWQNSSAVFWVNPSFPVDTMTFKVGLPDRSGYNEPLTMYFHPVRGMWRVYVPARLFPKHGETRYKIVTGDEYGNRHVMGEGILRVQGGAIYDPNDYPEIDPKENCYAKFPDGNWRRVVVFEDRVGALAFSVVDAPVDPSAFESAPENPYAYDKQKGLFYAVSGFFDSEGCASLSVSETGEEAGNETFARHDLTGFYYRVEATTDTTGSTTLVVGDRLENNA